MYLYNIFIKLIPNLQNDTLVENDTIYVKGEETIIPGCLIKTIKSIERLIETDQFDYIFRTNMSSVVNINKLYEMVKNCKKDYHGVIGQLKNIYFASGAGILLSKNMCELLVKNNNLLDYNLCDDVSIGRFAELSNVELNFLTRFEVYSNICR